MKNKSTLLLIFHLLILLVSIASLFILLRDYQDKTRGVSIAPISPLVSPFGVNASLEQYANDADLNRALELIRGAGFVLVRQFFNWNDIEPRANEFNWDKWDTIVARADAYGLKIVAVIMTTPEWARDVGERDLVNAKPAHEEDFARFVRAFVTRYREKIQSVQIWDNPNVHPFWGRRNADPFEYVAILRAGALAARAVNPNVKIISAGLAYSDELIRAHPDYSDILFLRGMYDAGARPFFDLLGAKTYGMWSGPDNRRAAMDTFNFSRAILLREEMIAHSDADKPMWAVEMGWNALPRDWRGAPSPWGTDNEEKQSARLAQGIQRARSEWGWMPALFVQHFQPNARDDDPVWGFALVDKNFQPRALYAAAKNAIAAPIQSFSFDYARFYFFLFSLVALFIFSAYRAWRAFDSLAWRDAWRALNLRFNALPNFSQYAILITSSAAFYFSPNVILNFALLVFLVLLFSFRVELGLALTVFSIPFYLLPKNLIGGAMFSIVELLTLACVGAWGIQKAASKKQKAESGWLFAIRHPQTAIRSLQLETCDYAVLFFVLVSALSVPLAANFGVANRELRVNIIEPALLYALIRAADLQSRDLDRLIHAFILSAVAVSLIGLYQLLFTDYVIIGEGVRRVLSVYGSPNNLALYLDRVLPLAVALALFGLDLSVIARSVFGDEAISKSRVGDCFAALAMTRFLYTLAALVIAICLYFTYSRGALLLGLPAGLLALGFFGGKRARIAVIALIIIGAIVFIPFAQTERAQSFFQTGTGTGFFRVSVWQSAVAMIRDHPIFGVGLDNFLYEYPKYMNPDAWREPNLSHPHNIVLDFWARLGIAGVIALIWMVVEFYRRGLIALQKNRALALGLIAAMTAALAHGLIDAAFFYVDLAFGWMVMFSLIVQLSRRPSVS